jgi:caffeoyl-CoA O-methyltransferase
MNTDDTRELLREIDTYVEDLFTPSDEILEAALRDSRRAGLPEINVSPNQGRLLQLLTEIAGARRILEIGTLGGYSAIHFARALPDDGALISLEIDEHHAGVARNNVERAGLSEKVEIRVGDAHDLLASLIEDEEGPFDVIFIDADKESYPEYLDASLRLVRSGSLILGDNTIRGGTVLDPKDATAQATREFNERIARDPSLFSIALPYRQRPKPLQHRTTPDPRAHRRPDHSTGTVERKIHVTMSQVGAVCESLLRERTLANPDTCSPGHPHAALRWSFCRCMLLFDPFEGL